MIKKLCLLLLIPTALLGQQPPNIIYIMSDDHDADAISSYTNRLIQTPNIDRLAKEGVRFTRAFVGNSICGPSRATLLTGQHSHKNGMRDNHHPFDATQPTLLPIMHDAGYQTAVIGKWHLESYPSGFDYWKILPGQGLYHDPRMISMNGDTAEVKGYTTDVITDEALRWLNRRRKDKPFILLLHNKAPHRNFMPRLKYLSVFSEKTIPEPASLYADMQTFGKARQQQRMRILDDLTLCTDLKIDPEFLNGVSGLTIDSADIKSYHSLMNRIPEKEREGLKKIYAERGKQFRQYHNDRKKLLALKYQWYMQDYLSCVASVDENVGRLLDYLDREQLAQNTVVAYTSDQGFYLGENGWFDKRWMYDVSLQIPLLIRWPAQVKPNTVNTTMVQNIDFAPTFVDLAGKKVPNWMQGLSLLPLLKDNQKTLSRKYLYYHYYEYPIDHAVAPHLGIRGERYKLIYFYTLDEWELYDLQEDPNEEKNLAPQKEFAAVLKKMREELIKARDKYDDHEPAGQLH
jgi:arylsulfatase A-like enzyme